MTIADPDFDCMERLAGVPKHGDGVCLHRMMWFLDTLDDDWRSTVDTVRVTGSNGKGSVCAMLAATFDQLGIVHGLYTSPHLRHSRERIVIGGEPIPNQELTEAWDFTERRIADWSGYHPDRFGAFEIMTAVALRCFEQHALSTVIVEAGLGGRYDPTRVLPGKVVGLTSLDLEHSDLLGDRLELIAYDKADLCPDGGTLVVGSGIDADVLLRLRAYTRLRNICLVAVDDVCRLLDCRFEGSTMRLDMELRGRRLEGVELVMMGRHQWSNAVIAFLLAEAWARRHRPGLGEDELIATWRRGLRRAKLAGRFDMVANDPEIYVDICHSPRAAEALVRVAGEALAGRRILLVVGVSANKEVAAVVEKLLDLADAVVCTRAWHLGSPVARIDELVATLRPELPRRRAETVEKAMTIARQEAEREDMTVIVAGSLFLAVEAMEALAGRDPKEIRFF